MEWVSERDLAEPAKVRLFCLPHAGSGAAGFHRWKRLLPKSIAVCPVMLPGRETRLSEAPLERAAEIVAGLHEAVKPMLDGPFAVFGHSMGALLAYEWARAMESDGTRAPECLFVSGRNAPQVPVEQQELHELSDEALVRELGKRYGGAPEMLLADAEMRAVFLPILRADLAVVAEYCGADRGDFMAGLRCSVRAFAGVADKSVSETGLERWREVTQGSFAMRRFPGGHFYHLGDGRAELLQAIAEQLEGTK